MFAVASGIEAIGGGRGSRGDRLDEIISLMERSQWDTVSLKFTFFVQHVLKGKRDPEKDTFNSFVLAVLSGGIGLVKDNIDNLGRLFLEDSSLWLGNACIILSMIAIKLNASDTVKHNIGMSVPQTPFGHKYMVEYILSGKQTVYLTFQPGWIDGNSFWRNSVKKHIRIIPDTGDERFSYAEVISEGT